MTAKFVIKGNRGSMTLEASILFSLVFFCLITLMYAGMLLYQQAYLQALVNKTAEMGALTWSSSQKDMYIGQIYKSDLKENDLYWRIIDFSRNNKETKVLNFLDFQIDAFGLLDTEAKELTAKVENRVLYNKLIINANQTYYLPAGRLLKAFGLDENITLSAHSEAIIKEPAEFVRTTDFIMDTGKELDRRTGGNLHNSGESIRNHISDMLNKAKEILGKL